MFGLPTHTIVAIHKDGSRESIMCTDVFTKDEMKEEIAWYIKDMIKHNNTNYENWTSFEYVNHFQCIFKLEAKEIFA